jgi:hypothetical protein
MGYPIKLSGQDTACNAEVGQAVGVEYAEAFRYERFSPAIERLLARVNPEPAARGSRP